MPPPSGCHPENLKSQVLVGLHSTAIQFVEFEVTCNCHMDATLFKISCFDQGFETSGDVYQFHAVIRL
jgi:hypothetical protein